MLADKAVTFTVMTALLLFSWANFSVFDKLSTASAITAIATSLFRLESKTIERYAMQELYGTIILL